MKQLANIFDKNIYCTLSTVTDGGRPWASPLFYVRRRNKIYWWSPQKTVHSQNIAKRPEVFITIFDSRVPEGKGKGIYIEALAEVLEDKKEINMAIDVYNTRSKVFKLSLKNSSGEAPTRIYVASIKKIWTNIDNEENGYFVDARERVR